MGKERKWGGPAFELEQGFQCQVNLFHFYHVANGEGLMGFEEGSNLSCASGCSVADRERAGLEAGRVLRRLL